ncbi:MAG: hypothetical protein V1827_05220 [Candidatus Micrarchaeota archaeon]
MTKELTIEEMQHIAKSRGGKCLSKSYTQVYSKLKWQCAKGHMWKANPHNIKNGRWCPTCAIKRRADKRRSSIEEMEEIAKTRGGKCLSKKYINNSTKLWWQCNEGHKWKAAPNHIKNDTWCPVCADNRKGAYHKLSIEDMQKVAKSRGGKCLSNKYLNIDSPLTWQCDKGHIWQNRPDHVKNRKQWCPYCYGNVKLTIEEMQDIAKSRGGKCLSRKYVNEKTPLEWRCKDGHNWSAAPDMIKQGRWCPLCSQGIRERVCRKIFERVFNKKFPKSRPTWLVNSRGNRMELDGYCKVLHMAFEFQGQQHYHFSNFYHKRGGFRDFRQRVGDDKCKRELCTQHRIILIQIPYFVELEEMSQYIIRTSKNFGIKVPKITKSLDYRLMDIYSPKLLEEMKAIAKSRGGKCVSKKYIDATTKLRWQCERGHIWMAKPNNIKTGTWCPRCIGRGKTIEDMRKVAESRFGSCLSTKYRGCFIKLRWRCKEGHEWIAVPSSVVYGTWCPICARQRHKKRWSEHSP